MWIFIWAVLSSFVLIIFSWSIRILLQQKAAWRAFADKTKLTYQPGPRFLSSPNLTGMIGPYGFSLYTEEQQSNDTRTSRFNTVLEIALRRGLPTTGAMGTSTTIPLIQSLRLEQTYVPDDKDWDATWMVRARHGAMVKAYLTPARLDILKKIFKMKVLSALFVFDQQDAVLRIETADPLNNKERLEKIVKGLIAQVDGMMVQEEEWNALNETPYITSPFALAPGATAQPGITTTPISELEAPAPGAAPIIQAPLLPDGDDAASK